jgi:hypothetical protein
MGEVYELSKQLFSGGNWGALDRHISFFLWKNESDVRVNWMNKMRKILDIFISFLFGKWILEYFFTVRNIPVQTDRSFMRCNHSS